MPCPRFTLRWLLLAVLIVAAYLGGFVHSRMLSAEREAMLRVEVAAAYLARIRDVVNTRVIYDGREAQVRVEPSH